MDIRYDTKRSTILMCYGILHRQRDLFLRFILQVLICIQTGKQIYFSPPYSLFTVHFFSSSESFFSFNVFIHRILRVTYPIFFLIPPFFLLTSSLETLPVFYVFILGQICPFSKCEGMVRLYNPVFC